jgi:hypothetical protein
MHEWHLRRVSVQCIKQADLTKHTAFFFLTTRRRVESDDGHVQIPLENTVDAGDKYSLFVIMLPL